MAITDEELREAATHRGLKLVKSRKRKPGVGDYGLFGLTDADGKPLFGVGDGGLTATAQHIIDFLRKGEVSTWAASANSVPDRPRAASPDEPATPDREEGDVPSAIRPRKRRSASQPPSSSTSRSSGDDATPVKPRARRKERVDHGTTTPETEPRPKSSPAPGPTPKPELVTELVVRPARPKDAEALQRLLLTVDDAVEVAGVKRAISNAASRKEPILVAETGSLIGCLAWHIIADLLLGDTARITVIVVDEGARREGVGRALYEAALDEFRRHKVAAIEAMSEIEVRNANGFYRAMGLKQASYRFATKL